MADITMPRLSDTMEEGTIATWLKKPGEQISKGEVIAQIETDKATMDLTAFEAGTLQEILAPEGTTVAIGQPVARLGNGTAPPAKPAAAAEPQPTDSPSSGEKVASLPPAPRERPPASSATREPVEQPATGGQAEPEAPPEPTNSPPSGEKVASQPPAPRERPPVNPAPAEPDTGPQTDGKVRASPMARHIAAEHGLDLAEISGSGPQGRVIRADVDAALSSPAAQTLPAATPESAAGDDDERITLSQMRRTIARRMAESTRTVPHFFLTTTVDATDMVALRKQILDQTAGEGIKITFNDMIVKAAALALRKIPDVNVSFAEDTLIRHKRVHIGVAVATERGLIVPVLRDVDQKSLGQIARETRELAERANAGKLQPTDYTGGTFTISNLGMFGVEQFNAVINTPEAAILAVGAIAREPAEHNDEIVLRERLKLTLSVDHRALDGAMGARYLQALKQLLEKPMLLLV
jgi:pyruvate dehydrogenase E2 component (dihydrolipoamide acetyltransferase)